MRTLFMVAALWIFIGWPAAAGDQRHVGNSTAAAAADASGARQSAALGVAPRDVAVRMAAVRFSPMPDLADTTGRALVWTVQGYYCQACRRKCVVNFKLDCDADEGWCRRQFTRCMRHCWEDECR